MPRRDACRALLGLCFLAMTARAGDDPPAEDAYRSQVYPLVEQYCGRCHGPEKPRGNINLLKYRDIKAITADREIWEQVQEALEGASMPPRDKPQPSAAESEKIRHWIEATLSQVECSNASPGRVTLRRLNRAEYNNVVRDLVGIDFKPADDFPTDDVGYGFDNIGDVLTLPPILMEKYLAAAEEIAKRAIVTDFPEPPTLYWDAKNGLRGGDRFEDGLLLASNGEIGRSFHAFPKPGTYKVRIRAYGDQAGPEPVKVAFLLDGRELSRVDIPATADKPGTYEILTQLDKPEHRIAVAFLNDYYNLESEDPKERGDRNLYVQFLEVQGPYEARNDLPASHKAIVFKTPQADGSDRRQVARQVIERLATRAFRRPVNNEEIERIALFDDMAARDGERFEKGIQLALTAILCSPNFLFHVEADRRPFKPDQARPLTPYEIASRLSFFLWSSMPDEELTRLAAKDQLKDPAILEAQVRRMLKDSRARAIVENFAGQWLQLRNLRGFSPDPKLFPGFDDDLRLAMQRESEMFFETILAEDRSILEFVDAKYTFVNERLARHYGIDGIRGNEFRKVEFPDGRRGGIVTQASVLSVTSNPTRTSPVKRGKWILEQVLGTPPPPAPPNVPELEAQEGQLTGSLKQKMEQHRKDPNCATCHERMDPLGFGLENYDPIGAWREKDGEYPVDPSGVLPGGQEFSGPAALKGLLLNRKEAFVRNLAERLLTYALGRGLESDDRCAVDRLIEAVQADDYKFSRMFLAIVTSDPFQRRGAERAD
ncbi:MAG: DUF1592 domain-containing protein [Isosphaeraceae bacterium]